MTKPTGKKRGRPPKPKGAPPPAEERKPYDGRPITVAAGADVLSGLVRGELEKLQNEDKGTATQRQNQIKRCVATLRMLGELTGETLAMPESKIVRLPAFRRVTEEMARTLEPWPDARRALAEALERMARGEAAEGTGAA